MDLSNNQYQKIPFGASIKYGKTNKEITDTMRAFLNSDQRGFTPISDLITRLENLGGKKDTIYLTAKDTSLKGYTNGISLNLSASKSKDVASTNLMLRDDMACVSHDDSADSSQLIYKKLEGLYNDFLLIFNKKD